MPPLKARLTPTEQRMDARTMLERDVGYSIASSGARRGAPVCAAASLPNMAVRLMGRRGWSTLVLVALCHLSISDAMPQQVQGAAPGAHRQLLVKKGLMLPPTVWNSSDLTSFDLNALTRAQVAAPHRPLTPGAASWCPLRVAFKTKPVQPVR